MVAYLCIMAVFYNDEEYYEMSGIKCNVQARSPSNEQQLYYTDESLQDILQIHQNLSTNKAINVHDVITAFNGDHPATQFKSGQQKGERYPRHGC